MEKGLDSFHLKLIAIIAMVINHVGNGFDFMEKFPVVFWFTEFIGKLTFPIMAFLLIEGFKYTSNRRKYATRLALFSLISVVPFHIYFYENFDIGIGELTNNVLFTLLIGLLMMISYEKTQSRLLHVLIVFISMMLTAKSDWAIFGIVIIFAYYIIADEDKRIKFPTYYIAIPMVLMSIFLKFASPEAGNEDIAWSPYIASTMLGLALTIPVLSRYNGERGYSPKWVKYGYYIFYPGHLIILYLIRSLIS